MLFVCTDQDGKAVTNEPPKEPVQAEIVSINAWFDVPDAEIPAFKNNFYKPAKVAENEALDPRTVADPAPPVWKPDGQEGVELCKQKSTKNGEKEHNVTGVTDLLAVIA